jgi:hypothetical protein
MTQTPPEPEGQETDPEELSRREAARQADAETIRNLTLENLMLGQGVNPKDGLGQLFFNGYKGELTEEAVASAIETSGVKQPPVPSSESGDPGLTPEERQQSEERQRLAAGATPESGGPSPDPRLNAIKRGDEVMAQGGSQEEAIGAAFDEIAAAGFGHAASNRKPDPRAQFDPDSLEQANSKVW